MKPVGVSGATEWSLFCHCAVIGIDSLSAFESCFERALYLGCDIVEIKQYYGGWVEEIWRLKAERAVTIHVACADVLARSDAEACCMWEPELQGSRVKRNHAGFATALSPPINESTLSRQIGVISRVISSLSFMPSSTKDLDRVSR